MHTGPISRLYAPGSEKRKYDSARGTMCINETQHNTTRNSEQRDQSPLSTPKVVTCLMSQVWQQLVRNPVGPSSEENVAVVMIADISGFTRLTAWLDETIQNGQVRAASGGPKAQCRASARAHW